MAERCDIPTSFDAWQRLAATDPEGFEKSRQRCIDEVIARAPEARRDRLQRLQWRIDQTRRRAGTPLAACISLSNMMWESLAGRHGLLVALRTLDHPGSRSRAKVLSFQARPD